ncbi:hypothetical protein ALC56_02545 [Trachymyrmex septentrionalis]|uniref:Gustatory receptor n=1 Tax=Trachymyrmex septentrionalis TaxID=34720 RepID=A0A195FQK1_9HYME|nr:hypothetical protein ALC56_02545 [Trachymyrmex septentrionalis]
MSSVRNLKQAVMPIIWLNCIFCMGIFEIPINRPRYFFSIFYVISIMIGYFIILYKGIDIFQQAFDYEFMIFHYVLGINILVAILAIILFWWKSENINIIIKRSNIVDNTLEALGIKREYQKNFRNILFLMALWLTGMIIICILHIMWTYINVGYWFAFYSCICFIFPIMINSVIDLTFASFIRQVICFSKNTQTCVQTKFQQTNTLINNIVFCINESNTFKIHNQHENTSIAFVMVNYKNHKENIMHLMQTLRHLHLEITRIGRQINSDYCVQFLFELTVHFTVVTSNAYYLYCVFSGHITANNEKIIAMAIWGSIYLLKIILINWLCTSASTEACKTSEILQSFEGSIIDNDMREEVSLFMYY